MSRALPAYRSCCPGASHGYCSRGCFIRRGSLPRKDVNTAATALLIAAVIVFGTIGFALFSVRSFKMEPAEFIVGGRSFGVVLLWMLLSGEIYTSFTFLGAAGWAYGKGAPAFYMM